MWKTGACPNSNKCQDQCHSCDTPLLQSTTWWEQAANLSRRSTCFQKEATLSCWENMGKQPFVLFWGTRCEGEGALHECCCLAEHIQKPTFSILFMVSTSRGRLSLLLLSVWTSLTSMHFPALLLKTMPKACASPFRSPDLLECFAAMGREWECDEVAPFCAPASRWERGLRCKSRSSDLKLQLKKHAPPLSKAWVWTLAQVCVLRCFKSNIMICTRMHTLHYGDLTWCQPALPDNTGKLN